MFLDEVTGGVVGVGKEIRELGVQVWNRKRNCRTFKASPSEAAPAGPMRFQYKLTAVTDLFVCETGDVRKVFLGEVTGGLCGIVWVERESESTELKVEQERNSRTFRASPSEAAPSSPMLLNCKLTDVTALFIC